jgi:hypothetical protein
MASQLYNRLVHGLPETQLPGFGGSAHAFMELEGHETQAQLQPLLLQALKQLGVMGFEEAASAKELAAVLRQVAEERRILLVLDNVWTDDQLGLLLPRKLHDDSRVIVTTREEWMTKSEAWRVRVMLALVHTHVAVLASALALQLRSVQCHRARCTLIPLLVQSTCGGGSTCEVCLGDTQ